MTSRGRKVAAALLAAMALIFGALAIGFIGRASSELATTALTSGALAVIFLVSKPPAKGKAAIRVNTMPRLAIAAAVMLVCLAVVFFTVDRFAGFTVAAIESGIFGAVIVAAVVIGYLRIRPGAAPPA